MFIKHWVYSTWLRVTQQIWLINMIYDLLIGLWSSSLLSRLAGETVDAPSITPWYHHFYACWSDSGFQWKHLELFAWGLPWSTYIAGHKCQGVNTPHSHPEEQPSTMEDGRRWLCIPIFLPLVRFYTISQNYLVRLCALVTAVIKHLFFLLFPISHPYSPTKVY